MARLGKLIQEATELAEVYALADRRTEYRILSELIEAVEDEDTHMAGSKLSADSLSGLPSDGCP